MGLRAALVLAAAATAAALPVRADPAGWYVGAAGGWAKLDSVESADSSLNFTSTEGHGFTVLGLGGYDFGGLFRAEGELGYHRHDVRSLHVVNDGGLGAQLGVGSLSGASSNPSGSVSAFSFMVNGIVNLLPSWRVTPYVGAGIGGADVSLNKFQVANAVIADSSDLVAAAQGIAGIAGQISPHVSLALDYRYFLTMDPSFRDAGGASFRTKYREQNVLLSVVYHFGAPPPAPLPPAPAPVAAPAPIPAAPVPPPAAQPQLFLVFFDFDQATLTAAGKQVIEQAASAYRSGGVARLNVTGYTDLAGTAAYNLRLSRRRADAVRAYLVTLGVPAAAIVEAARGKENPRIPTADGVREPGNRRVEIVLP